MADEPWGPHSRRVLDGKRTTPAQIACDPVAEAWLMIAVDFQR
jgi:hypothetical protein